MLCPACQAPNSSIIRTRQDPDEPATSRLHACQNPRCKRAWLTHEYFVRYADTWASPTEVEQLLLTLAKLPSPQLQQLRSLLDELERR